MKKLMILAGLTMMSVIASAATCNWYCGEIYDYVEPTAGDVNTGYTAYFFQTADLTQEAASTAIAKGDFSFLSLGFADDTTVADGELYGTTTHGNGETVEGYAIVFNNAVPGSADHYYMTDIESATTGTSGQAANLSIDASGSQTAANWQTIPEPTSGLLLLLGVAGLALKRKRA